MRRLLAATATLLLLPAAARAATTPTASTGSASSITTSGATVAGTVNPGGADTTYSVQIGTTTGYGLSSAPQTLAASTTDTPVTVTLGGLAANTTYHYRLEATNSEGSANGSDRTFKTSAPPAGPGASTSAASSITSTTAQLNGAADPNGSAATYAFEYGPTTAYGTQTADTSAGNGSTARSVSAKVGGLQPGTTYHFRLRVTTSVGTTRSSDRSFTTSAAPTSLVLGQPAAPVTYGRQLGLLGQVFGGTGVASRPVQLQSNPYPFTQGFRNAGTPRTTNALGFVSFAIAPFSRQTLFRITAGGAASAPVTVGVVPTITLHRSFVRGGKVLLTGSVAPGSATGSVSLQRRGSDGHFRVLRRLSLSAGTFATTIRRRRLVLRAVYRADGGALLRADSVPKHISAR